jgi:hypothetical protein
MKKVLFPLIICIAGYFIWSFFRAESNEPETTPPPPQTPLEQVEAVLAKNPVHATELWAIYRKFPEIVRKQLKNRSINLSAKIGRIAITGIIKDKAELIVDQLSEPRVVLVDDMDLHRLKVGENRNETFSFDLNNSRLYLLINKKNPRHVFTEGLDAIHQCRLKNWNSSSVYFYLEPTP